MQLMRSQPVGSPGFGFSLTLKTLFLMATKSTVIFTPGTSVFVFDAEEEAYFQGVVEEYNKRKGYLVSFLDYDEEGWFPASAVEESPVPNINDRFDMYDEVVRLLLTKQAKSSIISGQPGIGKSYSVEKQIEQLGLVDGEDYTIIRGKITPLSLYMLLYEYQDKVIILDDTDSAFEHPDSANNLKAVLDTTGRRKVDWRSNTKLLGEVPDSFVFNGSVLFLSNKPVDRIPSALISRSIFISLRMTSAEAMDRITNLREDIRQNVGATKQQADTVYSMLEKYKNNIEGLTPRTFHVALETFKSTGNEKLLRYQLLNLAALSDEE